ncbi:MAG: hypothetical protein M3O30_04610 [Planctomycetota bacterium]|nr:hypothetical protein [Planctomycetota bacterium]
MENIEAMLCAYIEGDLDEKGRVAIERHLQENPQHRKLIAELLATRDLVRELPRVKAPADVAESLRDQMERTFLLEDPGSSPALRGASMARWPNVLAIAAIVLLCVSLGIIVYKTVLPTFKPATFRLVATDQTQPTPGGPLLQDNRTATVEAAVSKGGGLASSANAQSPVLNSTGIPPVQFDMEAVRRRLEGSGYDLPVPGGRIQISPVVLMINSVRPETTNDQVSHFLSNQSGVAWKHLPPKQSYLLAAEPSTQPGIAQSSAGTPSLSQIPSHYFLQSSSDATTRPSTNPTGGTNVAQQSSKDLGNILVADIAPPTTPEPPSDVYVAQGLTRQGAEQLRSALVNLQSGVVAQVYDPATTTSGPAQFGVAGALLQRDLNDSSTATQPSDEMNKATTAPAVQDALAATTQPSQTVQSAPMAFRNGSALPSAGISANLGRNATANATDSISGGNNSAQPPFLSNNNPEITSLDVVIIIQAAPPFAAPAGISAASAAPTSEPATQPSEVNASPATQP